MIMVPKFHTENQLKKFNFTILLETKMVPDLESNKTMYLPFIQKFVNVEMYECMADQ